MTNSARPLRILIASPDTAVVRDLAWMLSAVGYEVETSKNTGDNAAWRDYCQTDYLIFDGRAAVDPAGAMQLQGSENPVYRIVLYDPATTRDLSTWFAAGANDALRVPISRGELLTRIRAGARFLEFENRMRSNSSRNPLLGIYSRRGFLRKLSRFSTEGNSVTLGHTLITTEIDFFTGLCRELGQSCGRQVLTALANSIRHSVSSNAIVAHLADGQLAALLPGRKLAEARVIADQIAQSFQAAQTDLGLKSALTLTTAIVPWRVGVAPEQLLEQARETLQVARQSGGNCALEQGDYAQELGSWQNELAAGSPFANVIAQDIMEPFPAVLERDAENHAMLAALHRSGAPIWPFVDRDGRLVGVSSPPSATVASAAGSDSQAITQPVTIAHNATFPEIYEAFSSEGCLTMVVVNDQRPVGYLSCDGFLSLLEPINSATFSGEARSPDDSRSLIVESFKIDFEPAYGSGH
jgi:diguanylate cyclase (GGDEF)-like protein